jgi:hypothetical protein
MSAPIGEADPIKLFKWKGNFYYINGNGTWTQLVLNPPNGIFCQTENSNIVTNTTSKTSIIGTGIGGLKIPKNTFKIGDSYHFKIGGSLSCLQNSTLDFFIETDSSILIDTNPIDLSATTDKGWELEVDFTIRKIGGLGVAEIQSNGQFVHNKNANNVYEGTNFNYLNDTTFSTEIDQLLKVDVQWGAAFASDIIISNYAVLSRTYYTVDGQSV